MEKNAAATLNDLRMSPRKVRLVADFIKGMAVERAEAQLKAMTKDAARPVLKLLQSAVAGAVHNHHLLPESLIVSHTVVNSGSILYRWMPRAMGRATPMRKRSSHLTLVLRGEIDPTWEAKTPTGRLEEKTSAELSAPDAKLTATDLKMVESKTDSPGDSLSGK